MKTPDVKTPRSGAEALSVQQTNPKTTALPEPPQHSQRPDHYRLRRIAPWPRKAALDELEQLFPGLRPLRRRRT